ncbi:MAG: hypothetical protein IIB71_00645 [Proteobacteria bacterium]|nr:hypothetical protein [Pseudomonadota bacterium]
MEFTALVDSDQAIHSRGAGVNSFTITLYEAGVMLKDLTPFPSQTVTVVDTTAPTFTFNQFVTQMWPLNKQMILAATLSGVRDTVSANPDVNISVTSNQGNNTDWNVSHSVGIWNIELRADRSGNSSQRVYHISVSVTDAAGNTGSASTTVVVPHDQGEKK